MMMYLITILLSAAIVLIALGIYTNNLIFLGIGGFFVGVYNATITKRKNE